MQLTKLKNQHLLKIKTTIWPSVKFELRACKEQSGYFLKRLCFWRWKSVTFRLNDTHPTTIRFLGRCESVPALASLLGAASAVGVQVNSNGNSNRVFVYEVPVPNTLCIPLCLSTIVKIDKSIEDILAGYSRSLRRSIVKQSPKFRHEAIKDESEIEHVERTMLRPYATARHDLGAAQVDIGVVKNMALNDFGRLDLLYENDAPVGCHLGNSYVRKGKRYWHVNRFGYVEEVFSDYLRWGEVNSINLHLALESAIQNGYDYCDYGQSLARPGAGLIEWKRRRRGFLEKVGNSYFYLKLPKTGVAQFLWDAPLFALEKSKITLHLGIPENKSEEDVAARYHEMGYEGLSRVYLYGAKPSVVRYTPFIQSIYNEQKFPPEVVQRIIAD
jgi:hypothetical protein